MRLERGSSWHLQLSLLIVGTLVQTTLSCTQVNLTNLYVTSASDLDPFSTEVSTLAGNLATQTCESISEVFDGDQSTKWLQRDFGSNGTWTIFRTQSVFCLTKYSLTSGNDFEGRDPTSWTLSGSLDGDRWIVLDHTNDVEFSKRRETLDFDVIYSHPFNWYKFEFHSVRDADSGGDMMQISDIAFFTGDCSDHSSIWFSFERRELAASFHTLESDTTSFLSLDECKELCVSYNTSADYYRDYQCSAVSYRPQWRVYGVDYSSHCELIQFWGEPQLATSTYYSLYIRDLGDCHDGLHIGDSCYRLSEDLEGEVDWETASASCVAWGGYLAVPEDAEEAKVLAQTVRPLGDVARWIGISSDGDCDGEYHASNNAQIDMGAEFLQFTSFLAEDAQVDAHCVSVHENSNRNIGKGFDDRACDEELLFICEKDMPQVVEDLSTFTCPGHTSCNGIGQYEITAGNWANDTVCGCLEGFVATGSGVECECQSGTYLAQREGTSGSAGKYCAVPRTCNKWGQYVITPATSTSDIVCGCLANATSSCDPLA